VGLLDERLFLYYEDLELWYPKLRLARMPVTQKVIRLLARYSEGLRLTVEHGPTSGVVLEYACQNTPQGYGALGRWIDRTFLHLSGWDSTRQRMQTTKGMVTDVVARRRAAGKTTHILDVASGTARYLRELACEHGGDDLVMACRDRDPRPVMQGRQLVANEALAHFTFSVGDATDESSYLSSQDPDIVLAIGLFPYMRRDDAVRSVMRLSCSHLTPGGCFICTTLTKPLPGLVHWGGDACPALRAPETIADWLRAEGFVRIDQGFSQPHGFALIGWKPEAA
jgi:SAM-dependent methyltransferase